MAEAIVFDLYVKAMELLGPFGVQKIAPYFGGRRRYDELQQTMVMIKARLFDAERRQEADGALVKVWLIRLKDVMYRLEDLLEEVVIEDKKNERRLSSNVSKMVRFLPSKLSSLRTNMRLCDKADNIMKELALIKLEMETFHFNVSIVHEVGGELNHIRNLREEIDLFIGEQEVIGRDKEKDEIVNMLLGRSDDGEDLFVVCIVGTGGVGKTTLAGLVYDDQRVQDCFELKCWACVADLVPSFQDLVGKVLHSIVKQDCQDFNDQDIPSFSVQELLSRLRAAVDGKKFLVVLENLWDNDHEMWLHLERSLRWGKAGSKILVTTRSKQVADNMGMVEPYVLKGLLEEKSWELFKSIAFKDGKEKVNPSLISIGKEIIKKYGNIPLAIQTVASLLCSRGDVEYWGHIKDMEIGMIEEAQVQSRVAKILKISYEHLRPEQKQCFSYCSLFPKDHIFDIRMLIQLWMAQGFIKSLDDGHRCFMELLKRYFFHNCRLEYDGEYCQMHDLMHDLAQGMGSECLSLNQQQGNVNNNIRHVMISNPLWLGSPSVHALPLVRSYLTNRNSCPQFYLEDQLMGSNLNDIFSSFRRLRALDLGYCNKLPESIGKLKHLRYLRVSCKSEFLPNGITKLQYLQTLDLEGSSNLTKLPTKFYKLTSLVHLKTDIHTLIDMPPRFSNLVSLQSMNNFVVGSNNGLDALARMNLVGQLYITFKKKRENAILEAKRANLKGKRLNSLHLVWLGGEDNEVDDEVLECLQPPVTLEDLWVENWKGIMFPNWGIDELPNLDRLTMWKCARCRHLPPLIQWSHLRRLSIIGCEELELWDVRCDTNPSDWASLKSLYSLHLFHISKLKSLPKDIGNLTTIQEMCIWGFSNLETLPESIGNLSLLRELYIDYCPKLEALPKSIQNLASLQKIEIWECPLLKTRCEEPNGDDRLLIQHIPIKDIR